MPPFINNLLKNTKALVGIGFGVVALIVIIGLIASFNGTQKDMVRREKALSAQYQDNQNSLDNYVKQIKEAMGVANTNTAALDKVLTDAVKGRYDGETSAQPGTGQMFSAITEAYPDLSNVSANYSKIQDAIFAGRDAFKNQQTKMLDMLREYETWKDSGLVHSKIASMVGAPSNGLVARIGTTTFHGQDALDQMHLIVTSADTNKSFTTGEDDGIDTNPSANTFGN